MELVQVWYPMESDPDWVKRVGIGLIIAIALAMAIYFMFYHNEPQTRRGGKEDKKQSPQP